MRFILIILVLIAATVLGVLIQQDPGYALFSYRDWTVEMPLWLAIMLGIVVILVSILLFNIIHALFSSPKNIQHWWQEHKRNRAILKTNQGLRALLEGRFKQAEKKLTQSALNAGDPMLNYLFAAKAAEENFDLTKRDTALKLAEHFSGESDIAVRLTQAQLYYKQGDLEKCLATLQHLHIDYPRHPYILKLLSRVYETLQDWQSLFTILPELRRAKVLHPMEFSHLEQKIYQALLQKSAVEGREALLSFWRQAPKTVRQNSDCIKSYCQLLLQFQLDQEAEKQLHTLLKQQWDSEAMYLYSLVPGKINKQLTFAETFLREHSQDPILLLSLGRLALHAQLWGKAKDYLEASFNLRPAPETCQLLAELMGYLEDPQKRNEYYKRGLLLATRNIPEIEIV